MTLIDHFHIALSVSTDSRKIKNGDIYFALTGDNFDGNMYALQSLEKGAVLAVVDDKDIASKDERCFLVDDVLKALQDLAREFRDIFDVPVIAITGSNGKTTTKELLASVISKKFTPLVTFGNLNNHIGVPLTLLNAKKNNDFFIIEMGANHQGEIDDLCCIAKPNFGLITNIGKAHLEGFGGLEGVKKGKSELYRYLDSSKGTVFLNMDDKVLGSLVTKLQNCIGYKIADQFTIITLEPFISFNWNGRHFDTKLFGEYNLPNIAAAINVGIYFNVSEDDIVEAISNYQPTNNRSELKRIGSNKIILDAYNSNPSSLRASLSSFFQVGQPSNKIIVLGDMLELGTSSNQEHEAILQWIDTFEIKRKVYIGSNFYEFKNRYKGEFYKTVEDAKLFFKLDNLQNKEIFLKGSRGIAVEKVLL
jgi:UDP-N-acetylmuramoyl-tripeptide--D-alanyl-D-alanine ligase